MTLNESIVEDAALTWFGELGYGDKWAVDVPVEHFPRVSDDLWGTLEDFMRFCRVTMPPYIERGLFT